MFLYLEYFIILIMVNFLLIISYFHIIFVSHYLIVEVNSSFILRLIFTLEISMSIIIYHSIVVIYVIKLR